MTCALQSAFFVDSVAGHYFGIRYSPAAAAWLITAKDPSTHGFYTEYYSLSLPDCALITLDWCACFVQLARMARATHRIRLAARTARSSCRRSRRPCYQR